MNDSCKSLIRLHYPQGQTGWGKNRGTPAYADISGIFLQNADATANPQRAYAIEPLISLGS